MSRIRIRNLKHTAITTLILLSAMIAVSAIGALIPSPKAVEIDPHSVPAGETVEVFSPAPQEITSPVFSGFRAPVKGRITSDYGYRNDPFSGEVSYHRGVDVAVPKGTEITASADGTVIASAYDEIGGHYVILSHGDQIESYYGHLQTRTVSKGDQVSQGDVIGLSGATGKVTGAHLHFQLTYHGRTVDPVRYLDLES